MDYLSTTKNMHKITLDADALNILSKIEKWWEKFKVPTLITPHMGEYEKLFKVKKDDILCKWDPYNALIISEFDVKIEF